MEARWWGRLLIVVLVGLFGVLGVATMAAGPEAAGVSGERGSARIDREECRVLGKINAYRKKKGRDPLDLARDLNEAADHHSGDMARHNYFSHTLHGGISWEKNIRSYGYDASPVGENIFAGSSRAGRAFKEWKHSRGHREAMLERSYQAIGVGRAYDRGSKYGWYWTTTFGGKVEHRVKC